MTVSQSQIGEGKPYVEDTNKQQARNVYGRVEGDIVMSWSNTIFHLPEDNNVQGKSEKSATRENGTWKQDRIIQRTRTHIMM